MDTNPIAADGNFQQWIACSRKRPFRTEKAAKDVASQARRRSGIDLGVYRCKHCGCFHTFTKRGKR